MTLNVTATAHTLLWRLCTVQGQINALKLPHTSTSATRGLPAMLSTLLAVCMVVNDIMLLPIAMFCTGSWSKVM